MPTAYPYCRVSTDQQTVEQQQAQLRHYFESKLHPRGFFWGDFYIDPATSAYKKFTTRRAGTILNGRLKKGDAIIFSKLDRAFRNAADAFRMFALWKNRGVEVHILDINVDTSTPIGYAIFGILAVIAEFERSMISQRTKDKCFFIRLHGGILGGQPPPGLRRKYTGREVQKMRMRDGKMVSVMVKECVLVPDHNLRKAMRWAWQRRQEGWTYRKILVGAFTWSRDDGSPMWASECRLRTALSWMAQRFQDTGRTDLDCLWDYSHNIYEGEVVIPALPPGVSDATKRPRPSRDDRKHRRRPPRKRQSSTDPQPSPPTNGVADGPVF
jgi:DNA invertase Pin-like site-specific DNA recombinase